MSAAVISYAALCTQQAGCQCTAGSDRPPHVYVILQAFRCVHSHYAPAVVLQVRKHHLLLAVSTSQQQLDAADTHMTQQAPL
jgi:hypothetical protein